MQTTLVHLLIIPIWAAGVCQIANLWPASILFSIPLCTGAHTTLLFDRRWHSAILGRPLAVLTSFLMLPVCATLLSLVGLVQLGPSRASVDLNDHALHWSLIIYCTAISLIVGCLTGIWRRNHKRDTAY
jgi:hypothetical protein